MKTISPKILDRYSLLSMFSHHPDPVAQAAAAEHWVLTGREPEPETIDISSGTDSGSEPALGTPMAGGYFGGTLLRPGARWKLIVAPKQGGEFEELLWAKKNGPCDTQSKARSLYDGFANSESINDSDHPAAQFCRRLDIGGFTDWYLPSREELNILCMNLFPRDGIVPEQTMAAAFRQGGEQAFAETIYWTSTEFSSGGAWGQHFHNGTQSSRDKEASLRVRAVRKVLI